LQADRHLDSFQPFEENKKVVLRKPGEKAILSVGTGTVIVFEFHQWSARRT
jgi:hypothetical protein